MPAAEYKTCARCRAVLPLHCFALDSQKRDGRYSRCKACVSGAAALIRVTMWAHCKPCGKRFRPRQNLGVYVRHCSRSCMTQATRGPKHHSWKGDAITYGGVHQRIRNARGRPTTCERCGATNTAMQWALDHSRCPSPLHAPEGPYSPDIHDYIGLCVPCHKTMDLARIAQNKPDAALT